MAIGRTNYTADAVAAARSVLLELTHLLTLKGIALAERLKEKDAWMSCSVSSIILGVLIPSYENFVRTRDSLNLKPKEIFSGNNWLWLSPNERSQR